MTLQQRPHFNRGARLLGAIVVFGQRKPRRATGLADYPIDDDETRRLADELWVNSPTLAEALRAKHILPDFEGPCEYTHRRSDATDIYFVSGLLGPVRLELLP